MEYQMHQAILTLGSVYRQHLETLSLAARQHENQVDQDACRAIVCLFEEIQAGRTTDPADARAAVDLIFACYRPEQFLNMELAALTVTNLLSQYPPGLVAMMTEPRSGIASREPSPPTLAMLERWLRDAVDDVRSAACVAYPLPGRSGPEGSVIALPARR